MRISVLSLDRTPERLASFLLNNPQLTDLHRLVAVDGMCQSREDLQSRNILVGSMPEYTDGAIGVALSHLGQWDSASQGTCDTTIAEDDAVFHSRFEDLATTVLAVLPPDWDIIMWGWNFDSLLHFEFLPGVSSCAGIFEQEKMRSNLAHYKNLGFIPVPYRMQRVFGLACYSVSPTGAAKLLRHCLPIRPMKTFYPILNRYLLNAGLDYMLNCVYSQINAYVCFPPLIVTPNDHSTSTVKDKWRGGP